MAASGGFTKTPFDKGSTIFYEGDQGDAMFIVDSGAVGIYKELEGRKVELSVLREGEMFGEMALVDGSPRMASAVAVEDCAVMRFPRDLLESKLENLDPFVQALINILVANLRNVHNIYMRRPQSINDHINAITYHLVGFRDRLKPVKDPERRKKARVHIDALSEAAQGLMKVFRDYKDEDESVLTDADLGK